MADPNFFPGFEGDDEPAKAAKPAAPKPAAPPAKPAFDPFAGVPVNTGAAPAAPPPAPAKPGGARAPAPPAPAPAPPPPPDADADIKPGARKDLWKCPHCGAGNKPDRDTCRTCGKSPDEPVVIPWYRNNLIRAAIVAAIGLVIIVAVVLSRVDLSLREPLLAHVDTAPRIAGKGEGSTEIGSGMRFEGERLISVCGKVAATGPGPGGTTLVALALGPAATEDKPAAAPVDGTFDVQGVVLACCPADGFDPKAGQLISLTGVVGVLVKDGRIVDLPPGVLPVSIDEHRTASP